MKQSRIILILMLLIGSAATALAQDSSSSSVVRRRDGDRDRNRTAAGPQVTQRMQSHMEETAPSDADLAWMRVVYRELDLNRDANTALYYPEDIVDGQENLFRIIMRLLAADQLPAYEYLDGREVFTDQYRIKVKDLLDRFHILHTAAKGSTDKHPKFTIDESDVPANEVLTYYIVERWEFDTRSNRMKTRVEAICPVLHRAGDFGGEAMRYPMFWVKYEDLKPYLSANPIFTSDNNNLATHTLADYFTLGLYDGDIYKTRNLRNRTLAQIYSDPDQRKHAQDSIQQSLENFGKQLWVPTLEELEARREAEAKAAEEAEAAALAAAEAAEGTVAAGEGAEGTPAVSAEEAKPEKTNSRSRRSSRGNKDKDKNKDSKNKEPKKQKAKKPKAPKSTSSSATRSVRNRRR